MSLETDLENFVRLCHLHEKVERLEKALAEKDMDFVTLKHNYAQLKEAYDAKAAGVALGPIVGAQTIINQQIAMAEKDREIEEKDTELGKLDAELIVRNAAYQQLMEKAVGLAETVLQGHRHRLKTLRIVRASDSIVLADKLMASPEVQAWKEHHE